jgi:hypothetical protein
MAQPSKQRRPRFGVGPTHDQVGIVFEEYLLRRADRARREAERQLADAVTAAVIGGYGWSAIGAALGIPAKVAEQRYGAEVTKAS